MKFGGGKKSLADYAAEMDAESGEGEKTEGDEAPVEGMEEKRQKHLASKAVAGDAGALIELIRSMTGA